MSMFELFCKEKYILVPSLLMFKDALRLAKKSSCEIHELSKTLQWPGKAVLMKQHAQVKLV